MVSNLIGEIHVLLKSAKEVQGKRVQTNETIHFTFISTSRRKQSVKKKKKKENNVYMYIQ